MTAFLVSDLPVGAREITTYEELITWAVLGLSVINPTAKRVLITGQGGVNVVQSSTGFDADDTDLRTSYLTVRIDTSKLGLSLPSWKTVKEVSSTDFPASFKG